MSGSNAGSFAGLWAPYATSAGQTLGISPALILQQWGLESGFGTNQATIYGNNPGGIESSGSLAAYGSPQEFTNAYVSTIESSFPGAVGSGSNAGQFIQGLQSGTSGVYWGTGDTATGYTMGLAGAGSAIASANPSLYESLTGGQELAGTYGTGANATSIDVTGSTGGSPSIGSGGMAGSTAMSSVGSSGNASMSSTGSSGLAGSASPCSGTMGLLSGACWHSIGLDVLLVIMGVALILFSAGASFLDSKGAVVNIARAAVAE